MQQWRTSKGTKSLVGAAGAVVCLGMAVAPAGAMTPAPSTHGHSTASTSSPPGSGYRVVASGLDNPRQLSFARNGDLYVAESGHGGNGPCIPDPDTQGVDSCFGLTGAITRIHHGRKHQVVSGLPSLAPQVPTSNGQLPPGAEAAGPSDVIVTHHNDIAFTVGFGSNPVNRFKFSAVSDVGHLLGTVDTAHVSPSWWPWRHRSALPQLAGDIAAFEYVNNPVPPGDVPDSNANAVVRDGGDYIVADAGGNDLLRVDRTGTVSLITTFPSAEGCVAPGPPPQPVVSGQAVPTSVVRGPHGAYYVSELTGFPFCEGSAVIWKVKNGHASVYASGLTNVTDLAFDRHGTLYAVEIAQHGLTQGPIGAVVRIPRGGGDHFEVIAGGLMAPYGIALRRGHAYVTVGSILPSSAGGGKVICIPLRRS